MSKQQVKSEISLTILSERLAWDKNPIFHITPQHICTHQVCYVLCKSDTNQVIVQNINFGRKKASTAVFNALHCRRTHVECKNKLKTTQVQSFVGNISISFLFFLPASLCNCRLKVTKKFHIFPWLINSFKDQTLFLTFLFSSYQK